MANIVYNIARQLLTSGQLDLATADLWLLLTYGYVPDIDADNYAANSNSFEATGDGYTRVKLTNVTLTRDAINNRMVLTADDITWPLANFQADGAVLFINTNDDTTSPQVTFLDFGTVQSSQNTPFVIQWSPAEGILNLR